MKWWVTEAKSEPALKKPGIRAEDIYPEMDGFTRAIHRHGYIPHVGYMTTRMMPCKCGTLPVLEQYVGDLDEHEARNVPATSFVAICPKCELKAKGHGTIEACIKRWNNEQFSSDAMMVRRPLKDPSTRGCEILSNRVLADAAEEAIMYVKRKHDLMEKLRGRIDDDAREIHYNELQRVRSVLRKLMEFFRDNPLVFTHDEDAILSGIRRSVYPDLTPEERIKIPLDLLRM